MRPLSEINARWKAASEALGLALATRLSLFYGALFLNYGVTLAYIPVWLDFRGLSPAEISMITAAPMFLRLIVTPSAAFVSDRTGLHTRATGLLAACALGFILLMPHAGGFWPLLVLVAGFLLATTTMMPLMETVAMASARTAGVDYGWVRLWGSLSFVVANIAAGLWVDWAGPPAVTAFLTLAALATLSAAMLLPPAPDAQARAARPPLSISDALALVGQRWFLLFVMSASAVQASHGLFYVFGVLHWRRQGLDAGWTGLLWAIAIAVEVLLFARSAAVLKRVSPETLIVMGGLAGIVRWTAMAFDPPLPMLMLLQLLHAFTFAATHLGTMHVIARCVPQAQAGTAQAVIATFTAGVAMGFSMMASGPLYAWGGGHAYLAMAAIACAGLVGGEFLRRAPPPSAP